MRNSRIFQLICENFLYIYVKTIQRDVGKNENILDKNID